jgi:hypothetical protein
LQRISTNIQESATNKINIITRERERKRERKRKEKTIAPPLSDGRRVWGWFAARAIGGTAALRLLLVLSCTSWNGTGHAVGMTVWPSGLRRWLQAPVRKGVGSNPTAVNV